MSQQLERITPMSKDFAKWYTDVVKQAELMEYGQVKGTMIIEPYGWAIWENIQKDMNERFAKEDVKNVAFPMFIPTSLLEVEKDHVDGFAPEVCTVTRAGNKDLDETFLVRPTSEVLFCDYFSKKVKTYRDLPMIYNQWCSVVRWEKETRPFLRSSEFHWQEGHTVHSTPEEAKKLTTKMLKVYKKMAKDLLAIPMFSGRKTAKEKFAGAKATYTIEAMMKDGKALQSGTSHYFGQNFTKPFEIKFQGTDNKFEYAYQTSWGVSTRLLGAIIMVHGDDKGLVMPPYVAPIQARIITIMGHKEPKVDIVASQIAKDLKTLRVDIDSSDKGPGYKAAEAEIKGIPVRIEVGPRGLENNEVTIVRRDTGEKMDVKIQDVRKTVKALLDTIHNDMYARALEIRETKTKVVKTLKELEAQVTQGYALAPWCGQQACEDAVKERMGATSRCIPEENPSAAGEVCAICGAKATKWVYFAKAY